jgi:hypothetical protein
MFGEDPGPPEWYGWVGRDVEGLGDVNGDGYDDVAIMADTMFYGGDDGDYPVYFVFGPMTGDLLLNGGADGEYTDGLYPTEIFSLGDVDGDGIRDVLLPDAFTSPVLSGARLAGASNPGEALFHIEMPTYYLYGDQYPPLAASGDIDGDGLAEIAVQNHPFYFDSGEVGYLGIVPGGQAGNVPDASQLPDRIEPTGGMDTFEVAMGDMTGDGLADLVTTLGGSSTFGYFLNTDALIFDGTVLQGVLTEADATARLAPPGDVLVPTGIALEDFDGDGSLDLAYANSFASDRGPETYFVYGPFRNCPSVLLDPADGRLSSIYPLYLESERGDFDGDGRDDLVTGSGTNFSHAVVYGPVVGDTTLDQVDHLDLDGGIAAGNNIWSIGFAGDTDGDGREDLIVGHPGDDTYGYPAAPPSSSSGARSPDAVRAA